MSHLLPPIRPGWRHTEPPDIHALRERERAERVTLLRARRREVALLVALLVVYVALFGRAAYWQIGQQKALTARADAEQMRAIAVPAGRGEILDATGHVLAVSVTHDTAVADPDVIRSVDAMDVTVATLAQLLDLPVALVARQLAVPGGYVQVRDANGSVMALQSQQSEAISAAIGHGKLPGIALIPVVERTYPAGSLAAQVLGFVSRNSGTGQYGVEQAYQRELAGQPGMLYTAVDAQGDPLATAPQRQTLAVPGSTVTLTLDANVQYWAAQGLAQTIAQTKADGGSVIIMDPHTGAIIAMASQPTFDPNAYASAPIADFVNPAVSDNYDPGSVMKAITMAAGIDSGTLTPDTVYDDSAGIFWAGATPIHNWDSQGHGLVTMTQVLQESLNTGAAWAATQIGYQRYFQYAHAFGFLAPTGVDLPSEQPGIPPNAQTPDELALAESAFGEGFNVTPLQLVAAYGALANGGVLMRPYVVASVTADGGSGAASVAQPRAVRQAVSGLTAQTVTDMLVQSAYSETQMYLLKGYAVAAKTGTSTPDQSDARVTYASVIGYAPAANPRFVLLVKLDHPRQTIYGSTAAAPLWRSLAQQLFNYYRIPPDGNGAAGNGSN
ncbi:MAG: peptidoglycan D,D-transpeptidase FtsI family protein [Ktedonobacterales bacterium]